MKRAVPWSAFVRRGFTVALAALLLASSGACGVSEEELQEILERAQTCVTGDTCILSGTGQCTCPTPINSNSVDEVADAVKDHDCEGMTVSCKIAQNPRCEQGRCVAD